MHFLKYVLRRSSSHKLRISLLAHSVKYLVAIMKSQCIYYCLREHTFLTSPTFLITLKYFSTYRLLFFFFCFILWRSFLLSDWFFQVLTWLLKITSLIFAFTCVNKCAVVYSPSSFLRNCLGSILSRIATFLVFKNMMKLKAPLKILFPYR